MKLNQLRKESLHFVFIKYVASKYKKNNFQLKINLRILQSAIGR